MPDILLFTGSSENLEECGISSVVTECHDNIFLNSFCFGFRLKNKNILIPHFSKHLFRDIKVRNQIIKTANGVTRFNVSKKKMENVKIPVPPLPIQEEIVRILDKFAELTAEFTKRKQQYQYYRTNLLQKETKNIKTVGEVCKFQNGFSFKSNLFKEEGEPILRITNIKNDRIVLDSLVFFDKADYKEDLEQFIVREGDFVVAMSGATTGKIGVRECPAYILLYQFSPKDTGQSKVK